MRAQRVTAIVTKVVISRDAQLVALVAVIVVVAANPDAIDDPGNWSVVKDGLPIVSRVDHTGVSAAFNQQLLLIVTRAVVPVPCFYNQ